MNRALRRNIIDRSPLRGRHVAILGSRGRSNLAYSRYGTPPSAEATDQQRAREAGIRTMETDGFTFATHNTTHSSTLKNDFHHTRIIVAHHRGYHLRSFRKHFHERLLNHLLFPNTQLHIFDPDPERLETIAREYLHLFHIHALPPSHPYDLPK